MLRLDPSTPPVKRASPRTLVLAGLATLLLAGAGGAAWWLRYERPSLFAEAPRATARSVSAFVPPAVGLSSAPRLSLVVLPLNNLGGDGLESYVVDGITEDLTTDLSRVPGLVVIARESAFTYKGRAIDIKRVGDELGVRYVLEGSVRKFGKSLRINAQLISAETGAHLWADRFDVDSGAFGTGQDEIVPRLATALGMEMVNVEAARSARERSTNPKPAEPEPIGLM